MWLVAPNTREAPEMPPVKKKSSASQISSKPEASAVAAESWMSSGRIALPSTSPTPGSPVMNYLLF